MAEGSQQTGRCLCGKVTFTIARPVRHVAACHCSMCQRWTGGPMMALHCEGPVRFEGEEHVRRYRSSDWAERGFCGNCGSSLFYFVLPEGPYIMSAGALDEKGDLDMQMEIFIDEKPGWYGFSGDAQKLTGAEFMAMVMEKDGSRS